jgi:hypothetical protein
MDPLVFKYIEQMQKYNSTKKCHGCGLDKKIYYVKDGNSFCEDCNPNICGEWFCENPSVDFEYDYLKMHYFCSHECKKKYDGDD